MKTSKLIKVYAIGYLIAIVVSFCLYFHQQYVAQEIKKMTFGADILHRYENVFTRKSYLLVNLWTVDCKSCNTSMQSFNNVLEDYGNEVEIWSASLESPRQLAVALDDKTNPWYFMSRKTKGWQIVDIAQVQDIAGSIDVNLVGSYLLIHKSGETLIGSGNCLFQAERVLSNGGFPSISLINAIQTLNYKIAFLVVTGSYAIIVGFTIIIGWIYSKVIS